jgi:hypothetical protein
MNRRNPELLYAVLVVLVIAALVILTWTNYRYSVQNPGGSDFLPRWVGTRKFITEGVSPYSEETTREIHQRFYGRPAQADEDQALFVYPLYSTLIFAPFAVIAEYNLARAVWMTMLEIAVLLITAISLSLSRWRLSPVKLGLIVLFAVLWYYSIRPLINSNASILIALLIAAAFLAIRSNKDFLAGLCLATATIKPQMVILLVLFTMLWSISRRRWTLLWSFLGSVVLMSALMMLFVPDWIGQNLAQILAYPGYVPPITAGKMFEYWLPTIGEQLGWVLTILLAAVLIVEWRLASGKDFRPFFWTACLTLTITPLIGIPTATENYLVMFPALIMVFAGWDDQWGVVGRRMIYISYILLFFGVWWLFLATLEQGKQPMQGLIMFFPLPVFLLVGLYWVRPQVLELSPP